MKTGDAARSKAPYERHRPTVMGTVRADRAAGIAVLARLRGMTLSRALDAALGLALSTATPEERAAIEAAARETSPDRAGDREPQPLASHLEH